MCYSVKGQPLISKVILHYFFFFLRSGSSLQYPKADYSMDTSAWIEFLLVFRNENEMFQVRENKVSLAASWGDVCLSVQDAGRKTPTAKEGKGACLLRGGGLINLYHLFFSFIILSFIFNIQYCIKPNRFCIWLLFYTSTTLMNNVLLLITLPWKFVFTSVQEAYQWIMYCDLQCGSFKHLQ